jgi:hypothetical protein
MESAAMTTITLELDDKLLGKITQQAKQQNVSVEEKILAVLHESMIEQRASLLERIDAIAAMTPKGVVQTDSTLLIREDRDR